MRVTGSKLALLAECGYWARDGVEWQNPTSEAASFGTTLHAMFEAVVEGREPKTDDPAVAAVFERHVAPWLNANRRAGWRAEVPFAIDAILGTARELPKTSHRDYSTARTDEVCLTTDLCYMAEDEAGPFGCVDDLKWSGFHGDALRAGEQLAAQAVAIAGAWGVDRVRARAIRVSETELDDATEVYWLDLFELEAAKANIGHLVARIAEAIPQPGAHCKGRWCPALASCPATTALVEQIVPADALARKEWRFTPQIESADHLQRLLTMVPIAKEYLERVGSAIAAYVKEGPVTATDGTTIAQAWRTMPRLDLDQLKSLAKDKGADDEEINACYHGKVEGNGVRATKPAKAKRAKVQV